ncbi:MAG: hypothetical protein J6B07_00575 [Opitutales bacterium]|nr:hypothetical protein [Opitutales bacterium]
MKRKIALTLISIIALMSSMNAAGFYWLTDNVNTLPVMNDGTVVQDGDKIYFCKDGNSISANVDTEKNISSLNLSVLGFSGSAGVAGNTDIQIGAGFELTINQLHTETKGMVADSQVHFSGDGTVKFLNFRAHQTGTTTTWNIECASKFEGSQGDLFLGENTSVSFSNLVESAGSREIQIAANAKLYIKYTGTSWQSFNINGLSVNGGTFEFAGKSGSPVLIHGTANEISSLSEDAKVNYFRLSDSSSLTIGEGVTHKIISANAGITLNNNAKLIINSKDALITTDKALSDDGYIRIECSGATKTAFLELGADNSFADLKSNNATSPTVFTITLNGNVATFETIFTENFSEIIISDFQNDLFRITEKDTIGSIDIKKITAMQGTNKVDVSWADMGGYYALVSGVVPEPAEWAMIFGAIALAFVAYRRK